MIDPLTISATAASALGTYNIVRWVVAKGIEKRREVKRVKALEAKIEKAVEFGSAVYKKVHEGTVTDEDLAKANLIADKVRELVGKAKDVRTAAKEAVVG